MNFEIIKKEIASNDDIDKLISITTNNKNIIYEYNSSGIRTYKKIINPDNTYEEIHYEVSGDMILQERRFNSSTNTTTYIRYIYDETGVVGFKTGTDINNLTTYYFVKNMQNDIVEIVDINLNSVVKYTYDAYGNVFISGTLSSTIGELNPYRYRGYYYDEETGLFMMGHRYYSPELCRFIQPDDIEYLDPSSINGLNLYCYCHNNPIMYYDPSGHMPEWAMWLVGGVLLAGSIALTIATWGAASGTILASVKAIAIGATISGITSAAIGTVAGGISYENGVASWDWSGAAEGFMWGSITGVISGAAGSALSNVGSGLAAYGKLGKLGYAGIQGLINSGIAGGLTAGQVLITGSFSLDSVGLSAMFGFAGGAIGITKWGEGIRNIIVGAGLGLGESSIGEIIEWWQSRQQTNMAYLRFAY